VACALYGGATKSAVAATRGLREGSINTGAGDDTVFGGTGDDVVRGMIGQDVVIADAGP
jgi:Ca2+-binding RTX toxin-like protein